MLNTAREKFSAHATPEILAALRKIAKSEGRSIQAVLDEALCECIERREKGQPRRQAVDAFVQNPREFDQLYHELAK